MVLPDFRSVIRVLSVAAMPKTMKTLEEGLMNEKTASNLKNGC